jgi:hypothetical protein
MEMSSQLYALANSPSKNEALITIGQQVGEAQSWFGLLEVRSSSVPAGNWNHFSRHPVCSMKHYTIPLK